MRSLTILPTPLLALLSTIALPHVNAEDDLKIDVTTAVKCSRPTEDGDEISVHYRGSLQSTGAVFDESYKRGQPITFTLGSHMVIDGWDKGLLDMCPGERRKLTIPPYLAYGESGRPPVIPGDSTLIFETELVDIVGVEQEEIDFAPSSTASSSSAPPMTSTSAVPPSASASAEKTSSTSATTATSTEETLSIATAPSEPPASGEEIQYGDVSEVERPDHKKPPAFETDQGYADVAEGHPLSEDVSNDLASHPLTPPSDSPVSAAVQEGECRLLGPFALIVQAALGAVALLSLVYKRWRESPKRPWKIFFFDVSKQVFGSFLTHVLNLAMSMLGSVDMMNSAKKAAIAAVTGQAPGVNASTSQEMPNPCSFYLLNLGIDTTLGIPVLYLLLRVLHVAFSYTPLARPQESIKSGHYGQPPKASWWLKQSLIYFIGLTGMKLFVYFLFKVLPWLPWVGDWALRWTEGNEALQVSFAMFIFPLAMNALQYWLIDSFIKEQHGKNDKGVVYERVQDEADEDDEDADALASVLDEEEVHVKSAEGLAPAPQEVSAASVHVHGVGNERGVSPQGSSEVEVEAQESRKRR